MISLIAPDRQNRGLAPAIAHKIKGLVDSPEGLLGNQEIELMELNLKRVTGYAHAIGCQSGTGALEVALRSLDLPLDSEVITPAFSYIATVNAIVMAGLRPVIVDVDPETGCLSSLATQKALTPKTGAILSVDLYGRQSLSDSLRKICQDYGIYLVQDGAHSLGSPKVGASLCITSFNTSKTLSALGNAGAVFTDDGELATRIREIRNHGSSMKNFHTRIGTNAWIDPLQAAVLNLKFGQLGNWLKVRRSIALWYSESLSEHVLRGEVRLFPPPKPKQFHTWSHYSVLVPKDRDDLIQDMAAKGIECGKKYAPALCEQPSLKSFLKGDYPHAVKLGHHVLNLPIYPELTGKELKFIVESLSQCLIQRYRKRASTSSSINRSFPRTPVP